MKVKPVVIRSGFEHPQEDARSDGLLLLDDPMND